MSKKTQVPKKKKKKFTGPSTYPLPIVLQSIMRQSIVLQSIMWQSIMRQSIMRQRRWLYFLTGYIYNFVTLQLAQSFFELAGNLCEASWQGTVSEYLIS